MGRNDRLARTLQWFLFSTEVCPVGWVTAGYSCYKLINRHFVEWQESTDKCSAIVSRQKRAKLVVIDNEEKQRLIQKLLFTAYGGKQRYHFIVCDNSDTQVSEWVSVFTVQIQFIDLFETSCFLLLWIFWVLKNSCMHFSQHDSWSSGQKPHLSPHPKGTSNHCLAAAVVKPERSLDAQKLSWEKSFLDRFQIGITNNTLKVIASHWTRDYEVPCSEKKQLPPLALPSFRSEVFSHAFTEAPFI